MVACLVFFTTDFSLFGIAGAHDSAGNPVVGVGGGWPAGLLFGLVVGGGIKGKLLDAIDQPGDDRRLGRRDHVFGPPVAGISRTAPLRRGRANDHAQEHETGECGH